MISLDLSLLGLDEDDYEVDSELSIKEK